MLQLKNIGFSYDQNRILENFNLKLYPGEIVALLGPSGRGKSTLAALIAGHLKPSSGEILLDEENVTGRVWRKVFLVSQENDLFPWLNVREQLEFARKKGDTTDVGELIKLARLEKSENLYPKELSGGMKKRLALVRALCANPRVLILDEVFSALDEELRGNILSDLKAVWKKRGISVIVITHDLKFAEKISERIVHMQ